MRRVFVFGAPVAAWLIVFAAVVNLGAERAGQTPAGGGRWTIPDGAETEKNPLPANAVTLANGKRLFVSTCQRCHGALGKGDGEDGDPNHMDDMDLTPAAGAKKNPDGVVFYKIWNGRESPKMPPQKDDLSKEQVWAIVAYVQTLRGK